MSDAGDAGGKDAGGSAPAGKPVPASFMDLLEEHARLFALFLEHQRALVERDMKGALEKLLAVREGFEEHVREEELLLGELFLHTDEVRGTPLDLFTGEHRHLRALLITFETITRGLDTAAPDLSGQIVDLLDEEALFKTFFRHHDERERNLLYPAFDRGIVPDSRRARLLRFHRTSTS